MVKQLPRVHCLSLHAKAIGQLGAPFVAQHGGTDDQQATSILPGAQFGPNQTSLDGLAQAHLICNQDAPARRVQELQHRLELVGQELRVGGVEAVNQVRELATQPRQGDSAPKMRGSTVLAALHQQVGVVRLGLDALQRAGQDGFGAIRKCNHQPPPPPFARRRVAGQHTDAARVVYQADTVSRIHGVWTT